MAGPPARRPVRARSPDRVRAAAAALAVLLLLLGGLLLGTGAGRPRADFAFCAQGEVSSLDPAIASGAPTSRILSALYEGLTRLHPATLEALPGLAERWEASPDGLTWTFHLRGDARWTNGDAVTAQHVAASLRRVFDPATASRNAYQLWCLVGARQTSTGALSDPAALGIEAPDARTLRLHLHQPHPALPVVLALPAFLPVHPPTLDAHGSAWVRPENIVTNGPFRLVERRLGERVRLARFDGYWGADEVALQTVDAYTAPGIVTQINLYLQGDVDWMVRPTAELAAALAGRPDVVRGPQLGTTFLRFNTWGGPFEGPRRPGPFGDERVRRALLLALDREALAAVMGGGERALDSFVPPDLPGHEPARLPPHDPARARELLAAAGFPGGAGFPSFALLHPHNDLTRDFCEAVATQWRRTLGVQARLVNQVFGVYLDSTAAGLYDVAWGSWIADVADAADFLGLFVAGSGNNRTGWTDPAYDALLARAALAPAPERAALQRQAEQLLLDAAPVAPLYQRENLNLVAPRVAGFHDNLLDLHPLRDLAVTAPPGGPRP